MKKLATALTTLLALITISIYFDFNASELDNRAKHALDGMVDQLKSYAEYSVHLSGHTDNLGTDEYNKHLAEKRINAVKKYLITKNVDSSKITCENYGEQNPIVANSSDRNRALNRRVELTISGEKINAPEPKNLTPSPITDTISRLKKEQETVRPTQKQDRKKKYQKKLVWTGWKTGFHWSTAGGN